MRGVFSSLARGLGWVLVVLVINTSAEARPRVSDLTHKLRRGSDFRVRVQAALELGKSKSPRARLPLERALKDNNAAVRAAAAAALKVLGDKRALVALKRRKGDPSPAVRSQILRTIKALRRTARASKSPRIVVRLGSMRNARGVVARRPVLLELSRESKRKFGTLPGVLVVDRRDKMRQAKLPEVMVTGHLRKMIERPEGQKVFYSAKVEYLLHRMPQQSIAGMISGSASATASRAEVRDQRRAAELRRSVIAAAMDSALRRAPEALLAATK